MTAVRPGQLAHERPGGLVGDEVAASDANGEAGETPLPAARLVQKLEQGREGAPDAGALDMRQNAEPSALVPATLTSRPSSAARAALV